MELLGKTVEPLRLKLSSRGGGVEISLAAFGYPNDRMYAAQNYLGGGMLGRVYSDCTLFKRSDVWLCDETKAELNLIAEELKKWFHEQTNPEGDYQENQTLNIKAY